MSKFLAKSFLWVALSEIIYNFSAYIIHSFMGRILGPADYGRHGIVITLTTMIVVLIGQGVPTAMSKYLSEIFDTKPGLIPVIKKQTAMIQFILIGGVTVVFFLFSPVIAWILRDPTLTPLFQLSTLVIPAFALASFYFYYYTGLHQFKIQAMLKTTRGIARVVFILGFAWLLNDKGYALHGAILGYVVAPLLVFVEAYRSDRFKKIKPEGSFNWRKLIDFAWPMTLFLIAYEFLITIDLYLVKGILHDDRLSGLYNAAITVARIPYFLFYALTIIILPAVSKSTSANNHDETKKLVGQSLRLMVMFLVPLAILMAVYSEPIIMIFFSKKFIAAAGPMAVLMSGVTFLTIFYVLAFALNGAGKVKVPMYVSFLGLAANVILSYFLISKFSLYGAAVATSLTSFIIMLAILVYAYRYFGYLFSGVSFLKIVLAAALMLSLSSLFVADQYLFIIWSAILFTIYLFILYLLREFGPKEVALMKQMLARKKSKPEKIVESEEFHE